jgi:4-hydroxy-3-polyprenylbenzoate decarboxylase
MGSKKLKIIIGITGASGSIYGKLLLDKVKYLENQVEDCGVVFSDNAKAVWA